MKLVCLFNEIDPFAFEELNTVFCKPINLSDKEMLVGLELDAIGEILLFMSKIRREAEIMLTWIPKDSRGKPSDTVTEAGTEAEEDPLKLINTYLLTIGNISQELLAHAKKKFFYFLYQSKRSYRRYEKKTGEIIGHTIAPSFKALIEESAKNKKEDIFAKKRRNFIGSDRYFN